MRDLLDAREAYHVHLSTLENVVATAIGRYLIRSDDWFASHAPGQPRPPHVVKPTGPRTLERSVVRPWSWPCVLVFVRKWQTPDQLGSEEVPRSLYLPDGRVIPTCVVLAEPDESPPPPVPGPSQASELFGGGYSCVRNHQGIDHFGTIACLVTRDGSYFALTNRHVAGAGGEEVGVYARGAYRKVGTSAGISSGELTVPQAFPAWPGERTLLTLDAGLIRIDDIGEWTSQAFGIGEIGMPFDATECTVTLDLIGCPMRAFGGTSGVIEGEIRALFFRYQSLGGIDRATDVLIGAVSETTPGARKPSAPFTRPGDSGTVWFYDPPAAGEEPMPGTREGHAPPERGERARRLRPVAMQWGGERFRTEDGRSSAFALASFLSTTCRELRVEVVRDWSTGHDEYWGKIGHFTIGWKACDRVAKAGGALGALMKANQERIGFGDDDLGKGSQFHMGQGAFVPLADVPDYVWVRSHKNEPIQHFADIDIVDIDGGPSLLERGFSDPSSVAASVWKAYFDGFAAAGVGPEEGAIPFRVWQLWDAMVEHLRDRDVLRFVGAAGVLAHYVGDASQPLHCSFMHHGRPPMVTRHGREYPVPRSSPEFQAFKDTREALIHGIYEETMLEVKPLDALVAVDAELAEIATHSSTIRSGHDAAVRTLALMHSAQNRLSPEEIIDADDPSNGGEKTRAKALWNNEKIRVETIRSLAESVALLADLWTSAWREGQGSALPAEEIREFEESELADLYRHDPTFVPSLSLNQMAESGDFEPPV
jgi:hypothetical protein